MSSNSRILGTQRPCQIIIIASTPPIKGNSHIQKPRFKGGIDTPVNLSRKDKYALIALGTVNKTNTITADLVGWRLKMPIFLL
jgi:hypothetical protein